MYIEWNMLKYNIKLCNKFVRFFVKILNIDM